MEKKLVSSDDDTLTLAFRAIRLHTGETTLVEDIDEGRTYEVPIEQASSIPDEAKNITPEAGEPLP